MPTLESVCLFIISKRSAISERELAEAIFGPAGYQQRVNQDVRRLIDGGLIERRTRADGVNGLHRIVAGGFGTAAA